MKNIYTIGVVLKRLFEDYSEVEIVGTIGPHTIVKDTVGQHFVLTDKLPDYFEIIEPETIVNRNYAHKNMDDPDRHNISGDMNKPSIMQQKAFEEELKKHKGKENG